MGIKLTTTTVAAFLLLLLVPISTGQTTLYPDTVQNVTPSATATLPTLPSTLAPPTVLPPLSPLPSPPRAGRALVPAPRCAALSAVAGFLGGAACALGTLLLVLRCWARDKIETLIDRLSGQKSKSNEDSDDVYIEPRDPLTFLGLDKGKIGKTDLERQNSSNRGENRKLNTSHETVHLTLSNGRSSRGAFLPENPAGGAAGGEYLVFGPGCSTGRLPGEAELGATVVPEQGGASEQGPDGADRTYYNTRQPDENRYQNY